MFQDWGFIDIYKDRIELPTKSRGEILDRAGNFWLKSDPHPAEKLSIDLFDNLALAPRPKDIIDNISGKFDEIDVSSAKNHLSTANLIDFFSYKDDTWYYSPEVFGENYERTIKFISNQPTDMQKSIYNLVDDLRSSQGLPEDMLVGKYPHALITPCISH